MQEGGVLTFTIAGVSRLDKLVPSSLQISQNLKNRSTCMFDLEGLSGYKPSNGEEIIVEHKKATGEATVRIFAGNIKHVKSQNEQAGTTVKHQVSCVDYNAILDKRLVSNLYEAQKVSDVINLIVTDFLTDEGITQTNVDTGLLLVNKAVFPYVKVSKVFDDLAISTGLHWYIDYYKDLHFFKRTDRITGASLSPNTTNTGGVCAYLSRRGSDTVKAIRSANISVERAGDKVVNTQFIIAGDDETDIRTESFLCSGEDKTFTLKYKVSDMARDTLGVYEVDAITLNGVNQTFAYENASDGTEDWTFTKGDKEVNYNESASAPSSGDVLVVKYRGLFKIIVKSSDANSIAEFSAVEGSSGIYESVMNDSAIESVDYAKNFSESLVDRLKNVDTIIRYISDEQELNIGDVISAVLPDHGINETDEFLVTAVSIIDVQARVLRYQYTITSSDDSEGWQDFFKKLERFGLQVKIDDSAKLIIGDEVTERTCISQVVTWSAGIVDLDAQDFNDERAMSHTTINFVAGSYQMFLYNALHGATGHRTPEVMRLGV